MFVSVLVGGDRICLTFDSLNSATSWSFKPCQCTRTFCALKKLSVTRYTWGHYLTLGANISPSIIKRPLWADDFPNFPWTVGYGLVPWNANKKRHGMLTNHPIEKGKSSEPSTSIFGFKMLIFRAEFQVFTFQANGGNVTRHIFSSLLWLGLQRWAAEMGSGFIHFRKE